MTRDEEDKLSKDDPDYLRSRVVVCNQVIYAKISGTFKDADGVVQRLLISLLFHTSNVLATSLLVTSSIAWQSKRN